ncbi:MAG TPA: Gfo/Idh/MocA family oxidoreductase [Armatimonadota bacterium]|jgi:predicted dehydrogenase
MDTLRIGLIGAGDTAGSAHMPSFAANAKVEVVAVADPDIAAARALAERFGISRAVKDYREIIQDPSVQAVDLCVPTFLHYEMAMSALNAGKHVICDKTIAMNLEEADAMIKAAKELGLWLLVVLNERFMPIHRAVKELINEKKLGKPFLANTFVTGNLLSRMDDASDWVNSFDRAGGGAFFNTGIQIVDLMRYWFGEPTAVTAAMKRLMTNQENKADDNASVILEWSDDMMANMVVSYTVANEPWSEKKFIYGTGADVSMISETVVPMFVVEDGMPSMIEIDHRADWWPWSIDLALRHFVDTIVEGTEPMVDAEDARAALKIVLAAYESARDGRRVEI